jgi:hypothetical protein
MVGIAHITRYLASESSAEENSSGSSRSTGRSSWARIGLSPISNGNSLPSLWRPTSSRLSPKQRCSGRRANPAPRCRCLLRGRSETPMTLTQLHQNPQTSDIPVLLTTARAHKLGNSSTLIALCAPGVIPKPLDPITLAVQVRNRLHLLNRA